MIRRLRYYRYLRLDMGWSSRRDAWRIAGQYARRRGLR